MKNGTQPANPSGSIFPAQGFSFDFVFDSDHRCTPFKVRFRVSLVPLTFLIVRFLQKVKKKMTSEQNFFRQSF